MYDGVNDGVGRVGLKQSIENTLLSILYVYGCGVVKQKRKVSERVSVLCCHGGRRSATLFVPVVVLIRMSKQEERVRRESIDNGVGAADKERKN